MTFIAVVSEDKATGAAAELYAADRQTFGYLPNFTQAFSARPAVYAAWRELNGAIKASMDMRRYELATVAAARRLRSSYCTLAHGSVLIDKFLAPDTVCALVADHRAAALDSTDRGSEPSEWTLPLPQKWGHQERRPVALGICDGRLPPSTPSQTADLSQ